MQSVIFCFGDSITHGAYDLEKGGWANQLRLYWYEQEMEDENMDVRVHPLGIPGETTEGLLARFKQETEARVRPGCENVFFFAYGANDCAFLPAEKRFAVDVEQFGKNLRTVIAEAKQFGSKVSLLTITPVVETITAAPGANRKSRLNEYVDTYNQKIREVAATESVTLVDVNAEFKKRDYVKLLSPDGLHPNAEGHRVIFENLRMPLA